MNYINIFYILFVNCCITLGQEGPCKIASNGDQGRCKSIFKCQPLLSIVNKANKTLQDKSLLKASHCGIDDETPAVCCPLQNETKPCYTPEGKPGQCISVYSCPNFRILLTQPLSKGITEFVRNSRCYGTDIYSVCCGPVPSFDSVMKGNCKLTAFPPDPRTECCGVDSRYQNKIFGGTATAIDQYPWLTMLEYNEKGMLLLNGVGTLISGKYVVSSASAVTRSERVGKLGNIVLGEYDISTEGPDCVTVEGGGQDCTPGAIKIPVESFLPHPQYNANENINDISLIRMKQNAPFTDFIRPICLPTVDVTQKTDLFYLTAAGWGITSYKQLRTDIKQHVDLPYVSRDQCQKAYSQPGWVAVINKTYLCAGGEEGKDTCMGDSSLMYKNGVTYEYTGIISFGSARCGQKDIPSVYTNIYEYNTWIRNNIVP